MKGAATGYHNEEQFAEYARCICGKMKKEHPWSERNLATDSRRGCGLFQAAASPPVLDAVSAAERAAIVKWLRTTLAQNRNAQDIASDIERGEHHK
jgi:mono/diheme cytochrome c family protein